MRSRSPQWGTANCGECRVFQDRYALQLGVPGICQSCLSERNRRLAAAEAVEKQRRQDEQVVGEALSEIVVDIEAELCHDLLMKGARPMW